MRRVFQRRLPTIKKPVISERQQSAIFSHLEDGGALFGDWVDEGTRSNGYNSGDVIQNPAYVIEDILRRVLYQTTANIDTDSFDVSGDATGGTIKDWEFMGALYKEENSKDVLERLCAQSKSRLFKNASGQFSLWTYDVNAVITYDSYNFDQQQYIKNLKIYRTPQSEIANTVRINYMLDRGSGNYQRQTFIEVNKKYSNTNTDEDLDTTETGVNVLAGGGSNFSSGDIILIENEVMIVNSVSTDTLNVSRGSYSSSPATHVTNMPIYILTTNSDDGTGTQDQNTTTPNNRESTAIQSVWRYGKVGEFSLDCDFIIDDTTAQELREHYFDYLKAPKWIVEFDTFLNVSDMVVNDIISFDSTILDSYIKLGGASWSGEKFVVLNIDRTGQTDYHIVAEHLTYDFV